MFEKKERLKVLISEFIEDGIEYEISTISEDTFLISFEPEYRSMDLFDFMNDSACYMINNSDFEIIEQNNKDHNFIIKVLEEIDNL